MGFTRYYLKEHNFLLTRMTGRVDDAALTDHIRAHTEETRGVRNLRELVDVRQADDLDGLSMDGTTGAARTMRKIPEGKLVILIPSGSAFLYGMARAFNEFSADAWGQVEISEDLNAALGWLADDEEDLAHLAEFTENV